MGNKFDLARFVARLDVDTVEFQKGFDDAEKKAEGFADDFDKTNKKIQKTIVGLSAAAGTALAGLAVTYVRNTERQAKAVKELETTLNNTSEAVGFNVDQLSEYARELSGATTFRDDEIIDAQSKLLLSSKVLGEEFQRTIKLSADLSAKLGGDLTANAKKLGRALNSPSESFGVLSELGVDFTESQRKVIKSLQETGREAEVQRIILDRLEDIYGGSAADSADSLAGRVEQLGNSFNDLLEGDGKGLQGVNDSLEDLNELLRDPETVQGARDLTSALIDGFSEVLDVVSKIPDFVKFISESTAAQFSGVSADDADRLNEALAKQRKTLERLEELRQGGKTRKFDNPIARVKAEIKELERKLEINKQIRSLGSLAGGSPAEPSSASSPDGSSEFLAREEKLRKEREAAKKAAAAQRKKDLQEIARLTESALTPQEKYNDQMAELARLYDSDLGLSEETRNRLAKEYKDELSGVNEAQKFFNSLMRTSRTPLEVYNDKLEQLKLLLKEGEIDAKKFAKAVALIKQEMKDAEAKLDKTTGFLETIADQSARNMQDAFADGLFNAFDEGLDGMVDSFNDAIKRILANKLAEDLFKALFGTKDKSGDSNNDGLLSAGAEFLGSLFGGGKAKGGGVSSGKFYLVGEEGPELFAPGMSGAVIPNNAIASAGGGGGMNITVHAPNAAPGMELKIRQAVQDAVSQSKSAIIEDFQTNGAARRALNG